MKSQMQEVMIEELQDLLVSEWYKVSREMKQFLPSTFPYLTMQGFLEEALKEQKNSENKKSNNDKSNTQNPAFLGG